MRANSRMRQFIKQLPPGKDESYRAAFTQELFELLNSKLERAGDALLMSSLARRSGNSKISDFPDATGYECYVNHVRLDDHLLKPLSGDDLFAAALGVTKELRSKLRDVGDGKTFRLILSCNEDGAGLRFHALRPKENWLTADLESYGERLLVTDSTDTDWVEKLR